MRNTFPAFGVLLLSLLVACDVLPQQPTLTPTRDLSAPTLAPSPTVNILNSQELYGDSIADGQNNPTAAALPNTGALPPFAAGTHEPGGSATVQIVLQNGEIVVGDLYETSNALHRSPGVLLIGRDRLAWGLLPAQLFAADFSVLVVDTPASPRPADFDVLLTSLSELGPVDPAHIAVVGAQDAADLSLLGCAITAICDAVVLLSPRSRDTLLNVLPNYNPRPMLVIAGQDDTASFQVALALAGTFGAGSQFIDYPSGSGTDLLSINPDLNTRIITWLQNVLTAN